MIARIGTLSIYLGRRLVFSLSGLLYAILALIFAYLFFQQPETQGSYYVLLIGAFGAGATFLTTLSAAARAHRAEMATWLVRLPSRIEMLAAVLLTGVGYALVLQLGVSLLALRGSPQLSLANVLEIPPVWLALDILIGVLALHATDLVASGWSRATIYGALLLLLFGQNGADAITRWLTGRVNNVGATLRRQGLELLSTPVQDLGRWLANEGSNFLEQFFGLVFWPFRAIIDALVAGGFDNTRALAPAFLLLYATILFLLAADFFATKDLNLTE